MARHSCVSVFAFITATLGLLSNVLSVGTTSWLISAKDLKMAIGIFRHCDLDTQYCGGMSEIAAIVDAQEVAWFRAVQALFLLACVGSLLVTVLIGLILINFFDARGTFKVVSVVTLGSVISTVTAVSFFGVHYNDIFVVTSGDAHLGYSFYCAILGACFLFLSFVASALEASQTSKVLQNMQHRLTVWSTPYTLFVDQDHA